MLVRPDYVHGFDVSRYQDGRVDYARVAAQGLCYAWVGVSQGRSHASVARERHVRGLVGASILWGAYHYATPESSSPDEQARHYVSVLRALPHAPSLRPVLDLEEGRGLGARRLTDWALAWLDHVEADTGVAPLLYAGSYLRRIELARLERYGLWIPHYPAADSAPFDTHLRLRDQRLDDGIGPSRPAGVDWACWQWTSHGDVPGVTGRIDLNVAPALGPLLMPHPLA